MKILAFSDMRTTTELPNLDCDVVALLGRIPNKKVMEIYRKYEGIPKVGLLTPTCSPNNFEGTDIVNLHKNATTINGIRIAGFGGVPRSTNDEPNSLRISESDCNDFVTKMAASNIDILLSYTNLAYGDLTDSNARIGFQSYNRIVLEKIAKVIIHGRLHSDFQRTLGSTVIYSVCPYKLIEV